MKLVTSCILCALVLLAGLTSSCGRRSNPVPPVGKPEPSRAAAERGAANLRFITEKRTLEPGQEFQPPRPKLPLALPEYPPEALAAHAGSAVVVMRFVVDEQGNVTDVRESPRGGTTPGPFAELFKSASEAAIRSWRYLPAELQWVVPGTDINGDGKPDFRRVVRQEVVPVYLDVRFEFFIEAGKPQVK